MKLDSLERMTPDHPADMRGALHELRDQLADLGKDLQATSHRLHSPKLEYLGLGAAADALCREVSEQHAVLIDFSHEGVPPDLSKDIALGVFRVLQEALNNTVKHAGVGRVVARLRGSSTELVLEVIDRGCGFDVEAASRGGGLGLTSMRERLGLMGGTLYVDSQQSTGTTLRAQIPLRRRPDAHLASEPARVQFGFDRAV